MKLAVAMFGAAVGMMMTGCGESHGSETDAGITFDAVPPRDTGTPDTGPPAPEGPIGMMCSASADCGDGGFCVGESDGFPGGYCTTTCGDGVECPAGSICVQVDMTTSWCLDSCDATATERTCRAGYGCATSFDLPGPVCLPGCSDDTDCPTDRMCDPEGGFSGEGVCFDPSARFGDECASETDCPSGASCASEGFFGWPGGVCAGFGCNPASTGECPTDSVCVPGGRFGGMCVGGCTTDADCRTLYECAPVPDHPELSYCAPNCNRDADCSPGRVCNRALGTCNVALDPAELGVACSSSRRLCRGGTCLTETDSGLPGSYCTYIGCDPDAADATDGCPGDGVCLRIDADTAMCLDGCATDADCRPEYACRPADPADPASTTACRPACELDTECANMGFECNLGTGLCRPAFTASSVGEPCTGAATCEGGVCVTEADEGWPAGSCVFPGCRLSGTGPAEDCPMGSVCVDDETGDPTLGVCVDSCDPMGTGMCRTGYGCTDLGGSAGGACEPACTASSECTGSRTCTLATGLCT